MDTLGFLTVGFGHLIKKDEKKLIKKTYSKKELLFLFKNDFNKACKDYFKHYKSNKHSLRIKEVYIEMVFQLGIDGQLKFKNMNKNIKEDKLFMAAFEMKNSLWYRQTPKRVDSLLNILLKKKYEKKR